MSMPLENSELSLLNATDDGLARFIKKDTFTESLLMNILFQHRVLVHETSFFHSSHLQNHVLNAGDSMSIFECAASKGLIIPAFRSKNTNSLEQVYNALHKGDIYGTTYDPLHVGYSDATKRLITSVDAGLDMVGTAFYWPAADEPGKNLGVGYLNLMRKYLQTDIPHSIRQLDIYSDRRVHIENMWSMTEQWRTSMVEEAYKRTTEKGSQGLQRMELFNLIGWSLGISNEEKSVGVVDLLNACADEQQRLAMSVYIKWITQIHNLNQANVFGTSINFPVYHIEEDFIIDSLLRTPNDSMPKSGEGFQIVVELPPTEILAQVNPDDLISIRSSGEGAAYLHALKRWQANPTSQTEQYVIDGLQRYAKQIVKLSRDNYKTSLLARFNLGNPKLNSVVESVTVASSAIADSLLDTVTTPFLASATACFVVYKYVTTHNYTRGRDTKIEVTLPL